MGDKVMFTAFADKGGQYGPFDSDRTLVFNTEITNIGEAYDATSGIFTAPSLGYYYFTFFYHAGKECKSGLTLMKNREIIVNAYDEGEKGPEFSDNAGNTAILKLEKGDKVFVRLPAKSHVYASSSTTTFTGFLISQI